MSSPRIILLFPSICDPKEIAVRACTIYFVCGNIESTFLGFPAADKEARKFLTGEGLIGTSNSVSTLYQSHAFLVALFEISADFLSDIDQRITQLVHDLSPENYPKTVTEKFRLLMSADQSYAEQGPARRTFYRLVCERASKVHSNVTIGDSSG